MNRLSVWNPWRHLPRMRDLMDEDWDIVEFPENEIDMYEEGDNVVVKIKAPGFKEENIDITIEDGTAVITGKIEEEEEEKDKKRKYYRKEFRSQSFTRRVDLPVRVKADQAEADYDNGVLVLTLPKAEEAKPQAVKVKTRKTK
ncbi:Hsp20/alpha crystallin family protein [Candidatus Dojkabacteria bacterium]|nr:Hsp20/alpha crystallin family protein [Candidatus Dojkabacteria bacterium]